MSLFSFRLLLLAHMTASARASDPSFCWRVDSEREADRLVRSVSLLSAISPGRTDDGVMSPSVLHNNRRPPPTKPHHAPLPRRDIGDCSGLLQLSHAPSVQATASPSFARSRSQDESSGGQCSSSILLNWRERLPFVVPVKHPELMSYDPTMYHSQVRKQVRDSGLRAVHMPAADLLSTTDVLNLNVERGVLGMSLRKHSEDFRMMRVDTYPGLVPFTRAH